MLKLLHFLKTKDVSQGAKTATETNIAKTPNQAYLDAYTASVIIIQNNFGLLMLIYKAWDNNCASVAETATDEEKEICGKFYNTLERYNSDARKAIYARFSAIIKILQNERPQIRTKGLAIYHLLMEKQIAQFDIFKNIVNNFKGNFEKFKAIFEATTGCYYELLRDPEHPVIDRFVQADIDSSAKSIRERIDQQEQQKTE